jgi:hypothetical protein
MNVKLLRKIQKHILAEPKRFIMSSWAQHRSPIRAVSQDRANRTGDVEFPVCGTAACIGGWGIFLTHGVDFHSYGFEDDARAALKLNRSQGERLFDVVNWPSRFRRRFGQTKHRASAALIAAERIDHFIATRGRE